MKPAEKTYTFYKGEELLTLCRAESLPISEVMLRRELLLSDVLGTDDDEVCRPLEDDADMQMLSAAIQTLNERERSIIVLRFGLGGRNELTQKEVADLMGISQSYISRIEKRIIVRLRREMIKQMQ